MKKKCFFIICLYLCGLSSFSQVIKVENGISFTSLNKLADKTIYPYQLSVGVEYMDKGRFNLSTNVGYLRKGGRSSIIIADYQGMPLTPDNWKLYVDYLTFNTTFDVKYTFREGGCVFIGAGPRVDFKINTNDFFDYFSEDFGKTLSLNDVILGMKLTCGYRYSLNERIQLGLNVAYLPSFTKISKLKIGEDSLWDKTFTCGLSLGYKLK